MDVCCYYKGYPVSASRLDYWWKELDSGCVLYLFGMPGLGKTVTAKALADWQRDLKVEYMSSFGGDVKRQVDRFCERAQASTDTHLLIVDDLMFYKENALERWIEHRFFMRADLPTNIKTVLISLMSLPPNLKRYVLEKRMLPIGANALMFDEDTVFQMLQAESWAKTVTDVMVRARARECFLMTSGYPVAVRSYIRLLVEEDPPLELLRKKVTNDVLDVLRRLVVVGPIESDLRALIALSVYSSFSAKMASDLLNRSESDVIQLIDRYPFFREIGSGYYFMPYMPEGLQSIFSTRFDQAARQRLWLHSAQVNERIGRTFEAMKTYHLLRREEDVLRLAIPLIERNHYKALTLLTAEGLMERERPVAIAEPDWLSAKALLAHAQARPDEAEQRLAALKAASEAEIARQRTDLTKLSATRAYLRALIFLPHMCVNRLSDVIYVMYRLFGKESESPPALLDLLKPLRGEGTCIPDRYGVPFVDPKLRAKFVKFIGRDAQYALMLMLAAYHFEIGQAGTAISYVTESLHDPEWQPSFRFRQQAEMVLVRVHIDRGDTAKAHFMMESLLNEAERYQNFDIRITFEAWLAKLALYENNLDDLYVWLERELRDPPEPIFTVDFYRIMVKATALLSKGDNLSAYQTILRLEPFTETNQHCYLYIELNILKAIALYRLNDNWQMILQRTMKLAAPYDLIHVFAEQGIALLPLWQELEPDNDLEATFWQKVLAQIERMAELYPHYLNQDHGQPLIELSKREREVLTLISKGKTNAEISDALFVSVSTVKYHIANLLDKLDAVNRTDAVSKGRALNLIK